jgi:nicotinamidase/pyrazinamidase
LTKQQLLRDHATNPMPTNKTIFWEVDTQADFMLPGGKLYVPGAECLLPNIQRLTNAARQHKVLLVSHGCYHVPNDPEFATFPPHCLQATAGADFVPEALTEKILRIPNDPDATIPADFSAYQQVLLEKQTLDIFESRHADTLVQRLPADANYVVFGVVTEYCVRFAAKGLLDRGRRVSMVQDAIESLNAVAAQDTAAELKALGATFITTDEALYFLSH